MNISPADSELFAKGSRRTTRFAIGKILVLGCVAVMVLHVTAVVGRSLIHPSSGPLVDIFALLDAGRERSLAAWWTAALLLAASVSAVIVAQLAERASGRSREIMAWRILALVLALLSFDEVASLHERGARWTAAAFNAGTPLARLGWLLPASAVLVLSLAVLVPTFRALPHRPRNFVAAGLATSICGAMGLELVGVALLTSSAELWLRYVVMASEEAAEMAGILIILLGISIAVRIEGAAGKLTISFPKPEGAHDDATGPHLVSTPPPTSLDNPAATSTAP